MKVSIITVSYNSVKTIEDTLLSVINQTYPNVEYLVIDGNSKDGTIELLNRYKDKISKIVSEPDEGIYDAMNKGIELASGEVVGILNSDDFYVNNLVLEKVVNSFVEKEADCVYSDLAYVREKETDTIVRKWQSGNYKDGMFLKGWMPPHPTFFLKRELYLKHGFYNTGFEISADYELMLRMLHRHKIKAAYLDELTIKMRVGGASNSSIKNRLRANTEDRLAWKMNDLKPNKTTLIRKPLSKILQYLSK